MGPLTPIIGLRLLALAAGLRHNAEIGQPGLCFSAYGHKFGINHLVLQLVSAWRSWSTRVEVKVKPMSILSAGQSEGEPVILFTLINHTGHPSLALPRPRAPLAELGAAQG